MLNSIHVHGRLTATPELRQTQSGVSCCNFTVAVDRSFARQGEERLTDFFNVVCWRGLAETVAKYFSKGKEIVVAGEMQSRKYVDTDGNNRIAWEIVANSVDFCGSKSDSAKAEANTAQPYIPKATSDLNVSPGNDDDVPF